MTTYTTKQGDMIDAICGRFYGYSSGAVESVLEANRDLAELGPELPAGIVIVLPDLTPPAAAQPVRLWD